jgi:hypothetical protein
VKDYNNFVLKWLTFALYVVVVPEQILLGSIWRTLYRFVTSVQLVYSLFFVLTDFKTFFVIQGLLLLPTVFLITFFNWKIYIIGI